MYLNLTKFIPVIILLTVTIGCGTQQQNQVTSENRIITEDKTPEDKTPAANNQSKKTRLPQKTGTISLEGEKTNISLQLYQDKNLFSTYFPSEDFLVETKNSDTEKTVKFIANFGGYKNENAYLQLALSNNLKTLAEVKKFINSKNGLIASNQWRVVTRSSNVSYPWAKEKITFSKGKDIIGDIYIGEENGKVFYVITHLPLEYGDGFLARTDLILSNLQIAGNDVN